MRSVRLLPVVILAAAALLLFKGFGLLTSGGYVLTGTITAEAAGGGHGGSAEGDAVMALPMEPTIADASPTLNDLAPTLPLPGKDAAHGAATESGHAVDDGEGVERCPQDGQPAADGHLPAGVADDCVKVGENLPTVRDSDGKIVPMTTEVSGSQVAIVERLGARREALDAREAELATRMALVQAAERRIAERTTALEQLEARINVLVEAKKASDDSQFNAIVTMYETMNPKQAAAIFDQLEMPVLLRVASAMTPRKMSQIMAKMAPQKARELTAGMAVEQSETGIDVAGENLAALPQIVGQ